MLLFFSFYILPAIGRKINTQKKEREKGGERKIKKRKIKTNTKKWSK